MGEGGETPTASASASASAAAVDSGDDDRAAIAAGLMSLGSASVDRAASLSPSPSLSSSSNLATDQTPSPSDKRRRRKGKARVLPTAKERQRRRKLHHRKRTASGGEGDGAAGAADAKEEESKTEGTESCLEDEADKSARSAGAAAAKSSPVSQQQHQPHEQIKGKEANCGSALPSSTGGDSSGGDGIGSLSSSFTSPSRASTAAPPPHHPPVLQKQHRPPPNRKSFKSPTAHFEHTEAASASKSKSKVLSREDRRRAGIYPEIGTTSPPILSSGTQLAAAAMASAPATSVYCDPGEGGACTVKRGAIYGNIAQAAAAATASMAKKKSNVKKVGGFGRADAIAAEEQIRTAVAAVYNVAKEEVLMGNTWSSRVRNGQTRNDEGGGKGKRGSKAGKGKGGGKGKGAGKDARPSSTPPPLVPSAAAASPAPALTTLAASASESSAASAVSTSAPALHTTEAYKAEAARLKRMRLATASAAASALHHTTEAGKAEAARLKRMKLNESYGRSVDPITEMRATAAAVRKVAAPTCGGAAVSAVSGFTPKVLTPLPHATQPHETAAPQPPNLPPLAVPQIHPRDKKRGHGDGPSSSSSSAEDDARRVRPRLAQHDASATSSVVVRPNDILVHPPYSTSNPADKAAAKAAFHRVGNRRFRVAVEWNLGTYFNPALCPSNRADGVRQRTVSDLVKSLGSSVPPARFLRRRRRRSSERDLEDEGDEGSYEAMSHDEVVEYVHGTFLRAGKALGFTTAANAVGAATTPPPATTGASPDASSAVRHKQQQQQQRALSPSSASLSSAAGEGTEEQDDYDVAVAAAALLSQQRSHPLPSAASASATTRPSPTDSGASRRREDMVRAAAQAIAAGTAGQVQAPQQQPCAPPWAAPQVDDGARAAAAAAAREMESAGANVAAAAMLAERRRAERHAKVQSIEMQLAALRSAASSARRFAEEEEKKGRGQQGQIHSQGQGQLHGTSTSSPLADVAATGASMAAPPSVAASTAAAPPSATSLVPGKNDVLVVQGAISHNSVGNRRLWILVECNLLSYLRAANRTSTSAPEDEEEGAGNAKAVAPSAQKRVDKRDHKRRRLEIIDGIVRAVRCCSMREGGGRFLQLSSSSGSSRSTTSCWAEMRSADIAKAVDRTFRECAKCRRDGRPREWIGTTLQHGWAATAREDGEKAPRAGAKEGTGSVAHTPAHFTAPAEAAAAAAAASSEDGRGEEESSSRKSPRSHANPAASSPAVRPHVGQLQEAGFAANAPAAARSEEESHRRRPIAATSAAPHAVTSDREKFDDLLVRISDKERELRDALRDERIAIAAAVPQAPAPAPSAGPAAAAAAAMGAAAGPSPGQVSLEEIRARTRQLMQQMTPKEVAAVMVSAQQQQQQQEGRNAAAGGPADGVAADLVVPGANAAPSTSTSAAAVTLEERIATEQLSIDELKARAKELLHQREMLRVRQMQQRQALVGEALLKARQHAQLQQQHHQAAAAATAAQHQAEIELRKRAMSEMIAPGGGAGGGAGAGAFHPSMLSLALAVQQAAVLLQAEGGPQEGGQRVPLPDETQSSQSSSVRDRISAANGSSASPPREAAWGRGGDGDGGGNGRIPARRVSVQAEDESDDELSANDGLASSEEAARGQRGGSSGRIRALHPVGAHAEYGSSPSPAAAGCDIGGAVEDGWKRTTASSSSSASSLSLGDAAVAAGSSPPPHDKRQQPHSIVRRGGDQRGSLTKKVDPAHVVRTGVAGQFDDCDEEEDIHLRKQRRQLGRAPAESRVSTQGNDLLDVIGGMMMMKNQSLKGDSSARSSKT